MISSQEASNIFIVALMSAAVLAAAGMIFFLFMNMWKLTFKKEDDSDV